MSFLLRSALQQKSAILPTEEVFMKGHQLFITLFLLCYSSLGWSEVKTVYRADSRDPSVIFANGFESRGSRMSILDHAIGGSCQLSGADGSAWVSTSAELSEAEGFATGLLEGERNYDNNLRVWVYTIRADVTYISIPDAIEQYIRMGSSGQYGYSPGDSELLRAIADGSHLSTEAEVVTHYIDPMNIVSATMMYVDAGDNFQHGEARHNPNYIAQDTISNSVINDSQITAFLSRESIWRFRTYRSSVACNMECDSSNSSSSSKRGIAERGHSGSSRAFAAARGMCVNSNPIGAALLMVE